MVLPFQRSLGGFLLRGKRWDFAAKRKSHNLFADLGAKHEETKSTVKRKQISEKTLLFKSSPNIHGPNRRVDQISPILVVVAAAVVIIVVVVIIVIVVVVVVIVVVL